MFERSKAVILSRLGNMLDWYLRQILLGGLGERACRRKERPAYRCPLVRIYDEVISVGLLCEHALSIQSRISSYSQFHDISSI